jgi:serine/threonine protein kinase
MSYFIPEILALLGALDGAGTAVQLGNWVFTYLRRVGRERRADDIRRFLEDLGSTAEQDVRQLVEGWARSGRHPYSDAQIEELVGVLVNLTRKARLIMTQGGARSSVLRSLPMIEQLLSDIQPRRRKGELVVPDQDWKLEKFLGMGTFGEVWMARNPGFPKPRAYKFFTQEGSLQWVRREQESLYAVRRDLGDHPNLIRFEDVAIENAACPYLALEYAGGGSLDDWILEDADRRPRLNKHDVILGLADGLAVAHDRQIYHRDLKPANVVLTEGPRPVAKITDFGLGKVTAQFGSVAAATQTLLVGTPMYLPPEAQTLREGRDPAQDDVFALGVLWYQLLVERLERPPYDFADELRERGADSSTIQLITRCLARPDNRFRNAAELRGSLEFIGLPEWDVPAGCVDVQQLFREYHASRTV